jgi:hypothetical protein
MAEGKEEIIYGCFRCGCKHSAPDDLIRPGSCVTCGEEHLLTHQESLDLLNELFLKGLFKIKVVVDDDEKLFTLDTDLND